MNQVDSINETEKKERKKSKNLLFNNLASAGKGERRKRTKKDEKDGQGKKRKPKGRRDNRIKKQ